MARLLRIRRLNSVDLPTLGRPIKMTLGKEELRLIADMGLLRHAATRDGMKYWGIRDSAL